MTKSRGGYVQVHKYIKLCDGVDLGDGAIMANQVEVRLLLSAREIW